MIFLNMPGYDNSGPAHWHSWLENTYRGFKRVEQDNWLKPERNVWLERLDETIRSFTEPVFLVGHSCGAVAVSQWLAEKYEESLPVVGALLVAPADVENPVALPEISVQAPLSYRQLPLPTRMIASTNDPHCSSARSQELATAWGSKLTFIEDGGHLASADGFYRWYQLAEMIEELSGTQLQRL